MKGFDDHLDNYGEPGIEGADIREEARAELESIVQAEDERWDGSRSAVDFSTQVADAILAAGYRKVEVAVEDVACEDHEPIQHRDAKPPWCKTCGLTATFEKPESRFTITERKAE